MKIKSNTIKIVVIAIFIILLNSGYSYAANMNVSAGKNTLNIGETTNLKITANGCAGNFTVTSSNSAVVSVSAGSSFVEEADMTTAITLTAKSAGTATITVTASDVTESQLDANNNPVNFTGSRKINITVTEQKPEEPKMETPKPEEPKTETPKPVEEPKPAEPTFRQVNETVYVQTESVNIRGTWSPSGGQYGTLKKGDSVTRTGISSEKINGYIWSRISYNGKTAYVISSALTTIKPEEEPEKEKSTNKALKELEVENYELTPKFDSQITKYSLTLKDGDEKLNIKTTPEDEKANVDIAGNEDFKMGNNIVRITVTAEDGTARIYTITVSKTNESGVVEMLKLSSLKISKGTLQPRFEAETTNYIITVDDPSTIKAEDIVATAEDKNVKVTVAENEQSENGDKIITIMLEDEESNKTGVYQITVKKPTVNTMDTLQNNNDNSIYYILGAIIVGLVILTIIIIVALKMTENRDYYEIEEEDELSDDYDYSLKGAIDEANGKLKNYDEMVEHSNFKSQILNSDISKMKKNNLNVEMIDNDENEYNLDTTSRKKGKHF